MVGFSGSFPHDLLDLNDWRWQGPVKENGALGDEGDRKAVSVPSAPFSLTGPCQRQSFRSRRSWGKDPEKPAIEHTPVHSAPCRP